MSSPSALSADGLTVTLEDGERRFRLETGQLTFRPGEAYGLSGASGTGKTLLLEILGLLRRPMSGRYGDGHTDFTTLWSSGNSAALAATRGRVFGFVPQTGGLFPFLSLRENVAISQRICVRQDEAWIDTLLDRLGLRVIAHLRPEQLSIGQRQRTAIARALAHRPQVVIADEPTSALDPETAREALSLMTEMSRENGTTLLLSSHDLALLDAFPLTRYELAAEPDGGTLVSRLQPMTVPA